jgi:hypothetical protein
MSPEKKARLFLQASSKSRCTGRTHGSFQNFLKLPKQSKKYIFPTIEMAKMHSMREGCNKDLYASMQTNRFEMLVMSSEGPFIFDHTCAEDLIEDLANEVDCLRAELLRATLKIERIKDILK